MSPKVVEDLRVLVQWANSACPGVFISSAQAARASIKSNQYSHNDACNQILSRMLAHRPPPPREQRADLPAVYRVLRASDPSLEQMAQLALAIREASADIADCCVRVKRSLCASINRAGVGADAYLVLQLLVWVGHMRLGEARKIFSTHFGDIQPTWFLRACMARRADRHVWGDWPSEPDTSLPLSTRIGHIIVDGDEQLKPCRNAATRRASREFADDDDARRFLNRLTSRFMLKTQTTADKEAWAWAFPESSKLLSNRAPLNAVGAALVALPLLTEHVEIVKQAVCAVAGLGGQTIARVLIALAVVPELRLVGPKLFKPPFFGSGLEATSSNLKYLHTRFRALGKAWCPRLGLTEPIDQDNLLYLPTLLGRFTDPNAHSLEGLKDRTEPLPVQRCLGPEGWNQQLASEIIDAVVDYELMSYAPESAYLNTIGRDHALVHLLSQGTTGSARSMRDVRVSVAESVAPPAHPTKSLALSCLTLSQLHELLKRPPQQRCTAIIKHEVAARNRMLLPGSETSWALSSYAMMFGEEAIYRNSAYIALGNDAKHELYDLTLRLVHTSQRCSSTNVCKDYADFNGLHEFYHLQHAWISMAKRLELTFPRSVAGQLTPQAFAASACRWVAASLTDARALNPHTGEDLQLIRGLWSGWRTTTLLNCLMNRAYDAVIRSSMHGAYGRHMTRAYAHGIGDDGIAAVASAFEGHRYLQFLQECGFEAQAAKQMLDPGRAEFLRLMYTGDCVRGSVLRAISSLCSSDLQSPDFYPSADRARAINDSLHMMVRRGADQTEVERLRYRLLRQVCAVKTPSGWVQPSVGLLNYPAEMGGMGCHRFNERPHASSRIIALRSPKQQRVRLSRPASNLHNAARIAAAVCGHHNNHKLITDISQELIDAVGFSNRPQAYSKQYTEELAQLSADYYLANRRVPSVHASSPAPYSDLELPNVVQDPEYSLTLKEDPLSGIAGMWARLLGFASSTKAAMTAYAENNDLATMIARLSPTPLANSLLSHATPSLARKLLMREYTCPNNLADLVTGPGRALYHHLKAIALTRLTSSDIITETQLNHTLHRVEATYRREYNSKRWLRQVSRM